MPTITKDVEVDVDVELEDFEEADIIEYCKYRGLFTGSNADFQLEALFQKLIVSGWNDDAKRFVEDWIYEAIGRTV